MHSVQGMCCTAGLCPGSGQFGWVGSRVLRPSILAESDGAGECRLRVIVYNQLLCIPTPGPPLPWGTDRVQIGPSASLRWRDEMP